MVVFRAKPVKVLMIYNRFYLGLTTLILSACGAEKSKVFEKSTNVGFSSNYDPPLSNFVAPSESDPNFKILEPLLVDPYWTSALEMDNGEEDIRILLNEHGNTIKFSFPLEAPPYLPVTIQGWAPATIDMISSSREIFLKLDEVLDVNIEESETSEGLNNFAVAQSIQVTTSGFSYFPNNYYQLGSDIFISKDFSKPLFLSNTITNYDYEILVHEIGHALGLKHPFESDRNNSSVLTPVEDNTQYTAMSYNHAEDTFDGTFRYLDWMTLTKFYGVNPEFQPGDDVYKFDDGVGKFIIDGNGIDTVDMSGSAKDIFLDLRPGAHSFEGHKSSFITSANQLTISHGSKVENAKTGSGDDTIIGNQLSNLIISGTGDDIIFAGEGLDVILPGIGKNKIDLSEDVKVQDRLVFEISDGDKEFDTLYGFTLGSTGDRIDLTNFDFPELNFLPLVASSNIPLGNIDYSLVRIYGTDFNGFENLESYLLNGDLFDNLSLSVGKHSILVTSSSQGTGENQNIYYLNNISGYVDVHHMAQLVGNYLDIDNWSVDNFII